MSVRLDFKLEYELTYQSVIVKHDFHFELLVLVNLTLFITNLIVSHLLMILFAFLIVHSALQWACWHILLLDILLVFFIHAFLLTIVFLSCSVIFLFLTLTMFIEHTFSLVFHLSFLIRLLWVFRSLFWRLVGSYFFRVHFQLLNNYKLNFITLVFNQSIFQRSKNEPNRNDRKSSALTWN